MKFSNADRNELLTGLSSLSFLDNFPCFSVDINLSAGEEIRIINRLRPMIPKYWMVGRLTGADGKLVDGEAPWDRDSVSLKNVGSGPLTATVLIFS